MIERVAGCLKQGGQDLLRTSEKPFRTRRHLHSAFWSHGAGDIDLPAWWRFLLQVRESSDVSTSNRKRVSVTENMTAGLQDIFLDFLYPVQTHAFIRRLDRATRSHQHAAQLAKQSKRKYTSIAEELLAGKTTHELHLRQNEEQESGDVTAKKKARAMHAKAKQLLEQSEDLALPEKCDEVWKLQQDAYEASQPLGTELLKRIFYSLSTSDRDIDRERSLALFEMLGQKTSLMYTRAVKAALDLRNADIAVDVHHEAVTRNPGSINIGTPYILEYAIKNNEWRMAIDTWYRLWQSPFVYFSVQRDLWKEVDFSSLQEMLHKVEEAFDFAHHLQVSASSKPEESSLRDTAIAAREFALVLAERAFEVRDSTFDTTQYLRLLERVKETGSTSSKFALKALSQLLAVEEEEHLAAALNIYSELRQDESFAPSQDLLTRMLLAFQASERSSEILMVLEDWQKYLPIAVPSIQYVNIARILANNGRAKEMEKLVSNFVDYCTANEISEWRRTNFFNKALRVYYKRADNRALVQKFDKYQKEYSFVPNVLSYNTMIMSFARVGDVETALSWFEALKQSGIPLNQNSFQAPTAMFAKRGDTEAVHDLWEECEQSGMQPDVHMYETLILVNIKNERYEEAEAVLTKAMEMELGGSRTYMWNLHLSAHALRGDLEKVSAIHGQMNEAEVPEDTQTYAALLLSLVRARDVQAAERLLKYVMPRLGIKRTVLHYAIVMKGFLWKRMLPNVIHLYNHLLEDNLVPDSNINNTILRGAAAKDKKQMENDIYHEEYTQAHQVLDIVVQHLDRAELATLKNRTYEVSAPIDDAFLSSHYGYMIYLYGKDSAFDKVKELYDEYIAKAKEFGREDLEASPPMMMLCNLMTVHRQAGNDEEVQRCWHLALDKLAITSRRFNANTSEPGWVLYARRLSITVPLREYMMHLSAVQRYDEMIKVVTDVRRMGYELTNHGWNGYIHWLTESTKTPHLLLAFQICENELMRDWPGWTRLASSDDGTVPRSWQFMKRALRRENKNVRKERERRMVEYKTLVLLASVYRDALSEGGDDSTKVDGDNHNNNNDGGGGGNRPLRRGDLVRVAPITTAAVIDMPRIDDWEQKMHLPNRFY